MTGHTVVTLALFLALVAAVGVPLGEAVAAVMSGEARFLRPIERGILRVAGVAPDQEMTAWQYLRAVLGFNVAGLVLVYAIERLQGVLPLNPAGLGAVPPEVAFNAAVSFASNTNWQAYGGETTMSYLTQMAALGTQNFASAATGIAVLIALIRGFTRAESETLGSFWVDLVRATLWVLLPLSIALALFLVSQGVVQTFGPYVVAHTLEGREQILAVGPAASQIAIKQLGTNGGGFFNVNSAHPFENPTPLSNLGEVISIVAIGGALCFSFGRLVEDRRQGWAMFGAMMAIFVPVLVYVALAEQVAPPALHGLVVDAAASPLQAGGNMEGKEARFGIADSAVWAVATTSASNGSVNSMHDSYQPLAGGALMLLIQLGEVVFGGVGSGLYGLLLYAIVAVFVAGLMVGRTPEYLGKKIQAYEMKMASLGILVPAASILVGTSIAVLTDAGSRPIANPGPHGFSEILYAFTSAAGNNGSAFGGITVNGLFYCTALAVNMFLGRYWVIVPVLAIAGSLARKKRTAITAGTLPTHTPLFVALLVGTVLLVGALTFVPALALGPIAEQLALAR